MRQVADRQADHQRTPYAEWECPGCQGLIRAAVSRMPHVRQQHWDRCATATPWERVTWLRTRRWPRQKIPASWRKPVPSATGCVCNSVAHEDYHEPDCPAAPFPFDSIDVSTGRVS